MAEYYFALTDINNAIDRLIHACPTTFYNGLQAARNIFSKNLAADVAPARHGRWTLIEYPYGQKTYICSECKDDDWWNGRYAYGDEQYCPNCGAKMDGGNE